MELILKHFRELTLDELADIYRLRVSVFVVEQNCPYQEIDAADKTAYHLYLKDEDGIQAYARVLPPGTTFETCSIGRVLSKKAALRPGNSDRKCSHRRCKREIFRRHNYHRSAGVCPLSLRKSRIYTDF